MSEAAKILPLTWGCHVCGRTRADKEIGVLKRDRSVSVGHWGPGTITEHVRYCLDNPNCVEGAKFKSFFPPFAPVDSSNLFLVGMSASGQVVIDGLGPYEKIHLCKAEAVNMAAWLRLIADPEGREFERLVEEIQGSDFTAENAKISEDSNSK
jgi:hypothetical protein